MTALMLSDHILRPPPLVAMQQENSN